jgi:hypothetical protein
MNINHYKILNLILCLLYYAITIGYLYSPQLIYLKPNFNELTIGIQSLFIICIIPSQLIVIYSDELMIKYLSKIAGIALLTSGILLTLLTFAHILSNDKNFLIIITLIITVIIQIITIFKSKPIAGRFKDHDTV